MTDDGNSRALVSRPYVVLPRQCQLFYTSRHSSRLRHVCVWDRVTFRQTINPNPASAVANYIGDRSCMMYLLLSVGGISRFEASISLRLETLELRLPLACHSPSSDLDIEVIPS